MLAAEEAVAVASVTESRSLRKSRARTRLRISVRFKVQNMLIGNGRRRLPKQKMNVIRACHGPVASFLARFSMPITTEAILAMSTVLNMRRKVCILAVNSFVHTAASTRDGSFGERIRELRP